MQHALETQQVLICYVTSDPAHFIDQDLSNLGTSDIQTVLLLKVNRKTICTNKVRNLRAKHNNEAKNPT